MLLHNSTMCASSYRTCELPPPTHLAPLRQRLPRAASTRLMKRPTRHFWRWSRSYLHRRLLSMRSSTRSGSCEFLTRRNACMCLVDSRETLIVKVAALLNLFLIAAWKHSCVVKFKAWLASPSYQPSRWASIPPPYTYTPYFTHVEKNDSLFAI